MKLIAKILSILFIVFISLFALDVFGGEYSGWDLVTALFIHLIPSFILILSTIIVWKKPKVGGWIFIFLGLMFCVQFNTYRNIVAFLILSFPLFLTGFLFIKGK